MLTASLHARANVAPVPVAGPVRYAPILATDAVELTDQVRDWNLEFTQLKPGKLKADGAIVELDGIGIARLTTNQTLLRRGCPRRIMVAMPRAGSGNAFVQGQLVESGQCVTLGEGALQEAITHGHFVDIALGIDVIACRRQLGSLNGGSGVAPGTTIAAPGPAWVEDMVARVEWLLAWVAEHPQSLSNDQVRASLADHVLAALVRLDGAPVDVDSTTRAARAGRRVAVRLAREFIHSRLSEPLRLAELCRHARLKIRSLEYGFREVTGLTPVAYIRSLRLNAVRRALQQDVLAQPRSISDVAMDAGFWHLSQFARDYGRLFGETPTRTRRRARGKDCGRPADGSTRGPYTFS